MSTFSLTRGSEAALGMLASQAGCETLLLTQPARELRAELSIEPFTSDSGDQLLAVLFMREQRHSMTLQRNDGANVHHLADWVEAVANGTLDTAEAVPLRTDPSDLQAATTAFNAAARELNQQAQPAPPQSEQQPVCWANSAALAKLRNGRNNSPCVLTDRPAEFNDTPLYANPQPEQSKLEPALRKICSEWDRQKRLFPELSRDAWMDLAIAEARCALSASSPTA